MPDSRLTPPLGAIDHVQGGAGAGVVELVEYGDFQCPHCVRAAGVVVQLRAELGDRLRFAFRHFPLTRLHPLARTAAEASEAAAARDLFWPMHDLLFARAPGLTQPDLLACAAQLGMDAEQVASELSAHVYGERIQRDVASAARSGVNGTPSFFINGRRHDGSYDVDVLRAAIEAAAPGPDQNPNK